MITGTIRTRRTLQSPTGETADIAIVAADPTPANAAFLTRIGMLWLDQSEAADEELGPRSDEAYRAYFASTAAFLAADRLTESRCCVLVAHNEETGEVVGLAVYTPAPGDWYIDDFTVSPRNQPGFPSVVQLRGIGGAMLAEIMEDVDRQGTCTSMSLLPLDEAALRFWEARGFHRDPQQNLRLTCEEVHEIAERNREAGDDRPDQGDGVGAGDIEEHQRAATPRVAERVYARRTR